MLTMFTIYSIEYSSDFKPHKEFAEMWKVMLPKLLESSHTVKYERIEHIAKNSSRIIGHISADRKFNQAKWEYVQIISLIIMR